MMNFEMFNGLIDMFKEKYGVNEDMAIDMAGSVMKFMGAENVTPLEDDESFLEAFASLIMAM